MVLAVLRIARQGVYYPVCLFFVWYSISYSRRGIGRWMVPHQTWSASVRARRAIFNVEFCVTFVSVTSRFSRFCWDQSVSDACDSHVITRLSLLSHQVKFAGLLLLNVLNAVVRRLDGKTTPEKPHTNPSDKAVAGVTTIADVSANGIRMHAVEQKARAELSH